MLNSNINNNKNLCFSSGFLRQAYMCSVGDRKPFPVDFNDVAVLVKDAVPPVSTNTLNPKDTNEVAVFILKTVNGVKPVIKKWRKAVKATFSTPGNQDGVTQVELLMKNTGKNVDFHVQQDIGQAGGIEVAKQTDGKLNMDNEIFPQFKILLRNLFE